MQKYVCYFGHSSTDFPFISTNTKIDEATEKKEEKKNESRNISQNFVWNM